MLALQARVSDELGVTLPEMDLGGGFGIAYTTQDDPSDPAQLATEMTKIVEHECRALGIPEPRLSIEPGRAIVGPAMCTVYTVGTVKPVAARRRRRAHLRLGRRRDERQHPHRALRRRLLLHARLAARSDAPPVLARVVGKHCEAGDIVVKDEFLPGDVRPGRPARGARHRCLLSLDGLQLQPRAATAGGRGAGRGRARRRTPRD